MLDLAQDWLEIVKVALGRHLPGRRVIAFGSRTNGKGRQYSDLDLCVMGDDAPDWRIIGNLKNELSESRLPIRVDILDWASLSPEFRAIIASQHKEVVQEQNYTP